MKFGKCLWLIPDKESNWHNYTIGFNPHMTIKTHLNEKQIDFYKNNIDFSLNYKIVLEGDIVYDISNKFHCLYHKVKLIGKKPIWWPDNPHISFSYRYDEPFSKSEIKNISKNIKVKNGILHKVILMNCDEHYSNWKKIKILNNSVKEKQN